MSIKTKIYLIIFASFFDLFVQLPIIAPYGTGLGGTPLMLGVTVGIYSLFSMTGNFLTGRITQHISPKRSIMYGFIFGSIFVFLYGFAASIYQLIIFRSLHGLSMSLVNPCSYAMLSRTPSSGGKAKKMALSGIAVGLASIIGPFVGGFGSQFFGFRWTFIIISIGLLIGALIAANLPHREEVICEESINKEPLININSLFPGYLTVFALMFAKGTLMLKLPLIAENLGLSAGKTGMLFSTFAIVAILVFASPLGKLSDKTGRLRPMTGSLMLISMVVLLISYVKVPSMLFVLMVVWGLAFGILFPAAAAHIMDYTEPGTRGAAYGIFYGVFSLGAVLGPVATSIAYEKIGLPELPLASGIVIILIITIFILQKNTKIVKPA